MGFFQKKNCNHPVEDINGKFHGVEHKPLEFQGVHQKFRKKHGFSGKSMQKMENSRGVTINLTGHPGSQLQKNRYPQQGEGLELFSGKAQYFCLFFFIPVDFR